MPNREEMIAALQRQDMIDKLQESDAPQSQGVGETFARSAAESATLGLSEPVVSGVKAILNYAQAPADVQTSISDQYNADVEARRKAKEEHDVANLSGQLAGAFSPVGPAGAVFKGSKFLTSGLKNIPGVGKVIQAVASGAIGAGTQSLTQQGVETLSGFQKPEEFQNVGYHALLGGGAGAVGEILSPVVDKILKIPARLESYSRLKAFKSIGATLKDFRVKGREILDETGKKVSSIDEIGQALIDKRLIKPGYSYEDIAEAAAKLKEDAGDVIGRVYDEAKVGFDELLGSPAAQEIDPKVVQKMLSSSLTPQQMAEEIKSTLQAEFKGNPGFSKAKDLVDSYLHDLSELPPVDDIVMMQKFKSGLQKDINYNRAFTDQPMAKQMLMRVRGIMSDRIQDRIDLMDQVLGGENLDALKVANKQYGLWSSVNDISTDAIARENARRFGSLPSVIASTAGASAGAGIGYQQGGLSGAIKGALVGAALSKATSVARAAGNYATIYGAGVASDVAQKLKMAVAGIPGIPTASKIQELPVDQAVKDFLIDSMNRSAVELKLNKREKDPVYVPQAERDAVAMDISRSQTLKPIEKAKMTNKLYNDGYVDQIKKLMNDSEMALKSVESEIGEPDADLVPKNSPSVDDFVSRIKTRSAY